MLKQFCFTISFVYKHVLNYFEISDHLMMMFPVRSEVLFNSTIKLCVVAAKNNTQFKLAIITESFIVPQNSEPAGNML